MQINQKRGVFENIFSWIQSLQFVHLNSGCAASSKNSMWASESHFVCNYFCLHKSELASLAGMGSLNPDNLKWIISIIVDYLSPPKKRFFLYELTIICLDSRFQTGKIRYVWCHIHKFLKLWIVINNSLGNFTREENLFWQQICRKKS